MKKKGQGASAFAAEAGAEDLDWLDVAKGLFGGPTLFLFGMEHLKRIGRELLPV